MIILPEKLQTYSAYDLLSAAGRATVAIDQRWLHALVNHPESSVPDIVRFASEKRENDPIPLTTDLISIFHFLKEPRGIPFLLDLIREDPADISDNAVEALVSIGQPAIEPLLELYREVPPQEGGEIAFLLAGMGIKDQRILDLLLSRLDLDWNEALFHLEVYGDPAALPALERRVEHVTGEALEDLRSTISDLQEEKPATHISDFNIWEQYPAEDDAEYDQASIEDRLEMLDSPDPEQRAAVAESWRNEEIPPAVKNKLIELALKDPEASVRGRVWPLFFTETPTAQLRQTMLERFNDPSTPKQERAGLAVALAESTDQPSVRQAVERMIEDPETRQRAIEAMWKSFDPTFAPITIRYAEDPDPEVRREVIWAIGYLNQSSESGRLVDLFEDEDLRIDALHNYALSAPGPTTRKKMQLLLEKIRGLADSLTETEEAAVRVGLDHRLKREGLPEFFAVEDPEQEIETVQAPVKTGRNDPCPCGSGKKYKKCCGQ